MFVAVRPDSQCERLVLSVTLPIGSQRDPAYVDYLKDVAAEYIDEVLMKIGIAANTQVDGLVKPGNMDTVELTEARIRAGMLEYTEIAISRIARSFR